MPRARDQRCAGRHVAPRDAEPLGWPPMVTCAGPAAAGVLVDGAGDLVAGLDDVALDYDGPDALLPLEHPATPATTVAAATAIIKSRFTNFSFG